jgi:exosortase A-associated hydrolase 1
VNSHETPVVIACQGDPLIGVIHLPEQPLQRGLLMIVAGGPQYRGGCCRQLVYASRRLAAAGIPVLRFDYRGMGDSAGPFRGFNHVENDLQAALRVFREYAPQVQEFILWGGCDAASASMINGWRLPGVAGLILGNPFVHSEETGDRVTVKHHYWRRIREKSFWMKVLRGQFNPFPALLTVIRVMLPQRFKSPTTGPSNSFETLPFQHKMREGIQHFPGHVLLLMSGKSLVSKEFDELLNTDDAWRTAMAGPASVTRHDLPDADQAFSTIDARNEMIAIAEQWLRAWPKPG